MLCYAGAVVLRCCACVCRRRGCDCSVQCLVAGLSDLFRRVLIHAARRDTAVVRSNEQNASAAHSTVRATRNATHAIKCVDLFAHLAIHQDSPRGLLHVLLYPGTAPSRLANGIALAACNTLEALCAPKSLPHKRTPNERPKLSPIAAQLVRVANDRWSTPTAHEDLWRPARRAQTSPRKPIQNGRPPEPGPRQTEKLVRRAGRRTKKEGRPAPDAGRRRGERGAGRRPLRDLRGGTDPEEGRVTRRKSR